MNSISSDAILNPHKGHGAARFIFRNHQMGDPIQRLRDIFFDTFDFTVRQKQVGGSYRAFPYLQQPID